MQRLQSLVFSLLNRHHFSPPSNFYKKERAKQFILKAGEARVLPLAPEFIMLQDGYEKQDCE
jgi:hypothetical protein